MYLNALLASLNARDKVRGALASEDGSANGGYQLPRIVGISGSGSRSTTAAIMTKPDSSTCLEKVILYYAHCFFPYSLLLFV